MTEMCVKTRYSGKYRQQDNPCRNRHIIGLAAFGGRCKPSGKIHTVFPICG